MNPAPVPAQASDRAPGLPPTPGANPTLALSGKALPWGRALSFVLVFGALYLALAACWSEGLSYWVIDMGTVQPAAWLARQLCADDSIAAAGSRITSNSGSINVLFGCEGTDVFMLLASAVLVSPLPWQRRLAGLGLSLLFVFALNQVRIAVLFFSFRSWRAGFGVLHGFATPLAMVVLSAVFYFFWLQRALPSVAAPNSGSTHAP